VEADTLEEMSQHELPHYGSFLSASIQLGYDAVLLMFSGKSGGQLFYKNCLLIGICHEAIGR
jgi:hypothetical protein